jgi:uncharacterized RDD family membrane protein YckC
MMRTMAVDPDDTARRAFGSGPEATLSPSAPATPHARDLADWWTRAGAFAIDQLVVVAIAITAGVLAGDVEGGTAGWVTYGVAGLLGALYPPLLMARGGARNGQTLGKQALGIRVVRTSGEPVTFRIGFLRVVIGQQVLTAITFYVYAVFDYLWPLRDPRNQALHDKIAKTLVVKASAQAPPAPPVRWLPPQAPGA